MSTRLITRQVAAATAGALLLGGLSALGLPSATAAPVSQVVVTVSTPAGPASGAFVAVRTSAGAALGGATTGADGVATVALRAATEEAGLQVVAGSPNTLVSGPVAVSGGAASVALTPVSSSVSALTYANTYGSQVEALAADGQSGVYYAITSTQPSVWRSTDYAGTWSATPTVINAPSGGLPQTRAMDIATSGYPGEVAVVVTGVFPTWQDMLWFSRDYGSTWERVPAFESLPSPRSLQWAHSSTASGADSSYLLVVAPGAGVYPYVMPTASNGLTAPATTATPLAGVAATDQVALATAPDGAVRLLVADATDAVPHTLTRGATTPTALAMDAGVALPGFGRSAPVPTAPNRDWEDVVRVSSLGSTGQVGVLVYERGQDGQSWSGVVKTARVDLSTQPAAITTNRAGDGSFSLAIAGQSNGQTVDPVAIARTATSLQSTDPCGENSTGPAASLADVVPSGPAAGFALLGTVRSCVVAFNASGAAVQWNGTGASVPPLTSVVIPVSGVNNNVGFVFDARFQSTNDAGAPVAVAISGDGQFGVRKSASFDANGRFDFGGSVLSVATFQDRQAQPGPGAGSGGVAVRGMVAPSISDEAVAPSDATGRVYVATLASSGGAQTLLTTDAGATFSTAAVYGPDQVAWWNGASDHQWILGEIWGVLRPKAFTSALGTGPLDMGEELAATAAERTATLPFLMPERSATLGGAEYRYESLIAANQGRITMTASAGIPGTDRAVIAVSDGPSQQSMNRGSVALVDLSWPADTGSQADVVTALGAVRYFGSALPAAGTTTDAQSGFGVGATSTYPARINAVVACPNTDAVAASVRDTAFVSVSGGGIDAITGVSGANPTWRHTGITAGNYRSLDVDCDAGVLAATPNLAWEGTADDPTNTLVQVSRDGAQTFTAILPTAGSTVPRVSGLSVAVAASVPDNRLTMVVGGQSGVVIGFTLALTDIPAGGADILLPGDAVQILNGDRGRVLGMIRTVELPPAAGDVVDVAAATRLTTAAAIGVSSLPTRTSLAVGSGAGSFSGSARQSLTTRTARITTPTSPAAFASTIRVTWASNGVVRTFQVQRAVKAPGRSRGAYAAWTTVSSKVQAKTMTGAKPGYGYCFRVRAVYGAGTTAWSAARCTTMPTDDRALVASSGWTKQSSRPAYLSTVSISKKVGAQLALAHSTGSALVLVVTKRRGGGTLGVYVNGKRVAKVSTASTSTMARAIVLVKVRTVDAKVTLKVLTVGRSGVTVDGLGQAA